MATGPQQKRKELREKRLKAESEAKRTERRQDLGKIIGAVVGLVLLVVVVAVVISQTGSDDDTKPQVKADADTEKLLSGLSQSGTTLGDPDAKVTLVEFADLQCPACQQYAEQITPDVIAGPIKDGTANFELNQWAILGPDSVTAAYGAYAAAEQDHYWNFISAFYDNQGRENAGYVTDDYLRDVAKEAGIPDLDKWEQDRADEERWNKVIMKTDEQATDLNFTGTPSFGVRVGDGDIQPINAGSADAIIDAIKKAAGK